MELGELPKSKELGALKRGDAMYIEYNDGTAHNKYGRFLKWSKGRKDIQDDFLVMEEYGLLFKCVVNVPVSEVRCFGIMDEEMLKRLDYAEGNNLRREEYERKTKPAVDQTGLIEVVQGEPSEFVRTDRKN